MLAHEHEHGEEIMQDNFKTYEDGRKTRCNVWFGGAPFATPVRCEDPDPKHAMPHHHGDSEWPQVGDDLASRQGFLDT